MGVTSPGQQGHIPEPDPWDQEWPRKVRLMKGPLGHLTPWTGVGEEMLAPVLGGRRSRRRAERVPSGGGAQEKGGPREGGYED